MKNMPIYQALAEAFVAEGTRAQFTLMGDGNMHWATALKNIDGVESYYARHEHCACAMAMGYHSATGKVGVASVTCGPGFTQLMTALTVAARVRIPLVVFAGEVPIHAKWYGQTIEQAPLATATGGHYIAAHSPQRMYQYVREAFYVAQHERRPVVLGVPYDLQRQPLPELGPYQDSSALLPKPLPTPPNPEQVALVAEKLAASQCPVVLAGRGVLRAGAAEAVEKLADVSGALLATTLPARGLFDHHPFGLGISGGYARKVASEMGAKADLVLAIGASLSFYTLDGGAMFPNAEVVQVDMEPQGLHQGLKAADIHLRSDARLTAEAIGEALAKGAAPAAAIRSPALADRIRNEPADDAKFEIAPGTLDPRAVIDELDAVLPKDYDSVAGSGHQAYYHTVMRGRRPEAYHSMRDFAAIGNGLPFAMGVAAVRKNGKVVLFDGDGSLLMHLQELEAVRRHGLKMLICVLNDGAYGAEIHKLRSDGIDDSGAVFGRADFAAIAQGFGLRGATVTDLSQFRPLFEAYAAQDRSEIWDIHISDQVVNPRTRRMSGKGH